MQTYELFEMLGEGFYSEVFRAVDKRTNEEVAIKKMKDQKVNLEDCPHLIEIECLNKLKPHDNIVNLIDTYIDIENNLHLVFDRMEQDLYWVIETQKNKNITEEYIKMVMWQIVNGLDHIHKKNYIHRDLKPENIMLKGDVVKIGDFGMAIDSKIHSIYNNYISTRNYRPPESLVNLGKITKALDIWAIGCIMAEMYLLTPLFNGNSEKEVFYRIIEVLGSPIMSNWSRGVDKAKSLALNCEGTNTCQLANILSNASDEALDFLILMLQWDPEKRATTCELLQHSFFKVYTEKNLEIDTFVNKLSIDNNLLGINNIDVLIQAKESDISKMLNETTEINDCKINYLSLVISKLKIDNYKETEEVFCFGVSPIINKIQEEQIFSFNKRLDDNPNISYLINSETSLTNKEDNKMFFDLSTLNKINGKIYIIFRRREIRRTKSFAPI